LVGPAHFPTAGGGSSAVAFVYGSALSSLKTAESGLNGGEPASFTKLRWADIGPSGIVTSGKKRLSRRALPIR
jgi:hypothetical protein